VALLVGATGSWLALGQDSGQAPPAVARTAATALPALLPHKDGVESFVLFTKTDEGPLSVTSETTHEGVIRSASGGPVIGPPRIQDLPLRPSIRFGPGVSYQQAMTDLYVARQLGKELPDGAVLDQPLPDGTAVLIDGDSIVADSAAPFGYEPATGRITTPTFSMPGGLAAEELDRAFQEAYDQGQVLPKVARVNADPLPRCQVAFGRDDSEGTDWACFEPGADREVVRPG
jgi:hypothetical protein